MGSEPVALPSSDALQAFARFSDAFDRPDFAAGEWGGGQEVEPGIVQMPYWMPNAIVSGWHTELYDRGIIDPHSNYLSEEFAAKMRGFTADPSLLSVQDLQTIRTVLTNISRGERFCEGYMGEMFENGVAQAATRRLIELSGKLR